VLAYLLPLGDDITNEIYMSVKGSSLCKSCGVLNECSLNTSQTFIWSCSEYEDHHERLTTVIIN